MGGVLGRGDGQHVSAAPRELTRPLDQPQVVNMPAANEADIWTLIKPTDVWLLWTIILGGVALSIYLEQTFNWAAKISGPVLALLIAMILASATDHADRCQRL